MVTSNSQQTSDGLLIRSKKKHRLQWETLNGGQLHVALSLLVSRKAEREKKRLLEAIVCSCIVVFVSVPITLSNTVNERDENHIMVKSKPRIAHSV